MKKTIFALSLLSSVFVFSQEKNNKPQEKQIEGVVITKTKKAVEQKADRTIFDFSEQPQLNNGNVLEGIKKLPGLVSTDIAGMMYQGKMLEVYLNGRPLNITSNELNSFLEGMPANSAVSNDMPVAPPSIKLFGIKKLSRPTAAQKIPSIISRKFFIVRNTFFPNCLRPFAISKAEYSDAFFPGFPSCRYCNIICLYSLFIGLQH